MNKANWLACVGTGWHKLVAPLLDRAEKEGVDVQQVKEKFGGLRFYHGPASEDFVAAVDAAEAASYITCETCGEPGEMRGGSWMRVLCDAHEEERKAKR